jgi:hypothetical protein
MRLQITERDYQLRHACPSVRMEQFGLNWTDFHEIWSSSIFRNYVVEIKVSLKYDNSNEYLTIRTMYIIDHLTHSFLEWDMFQRKVVEKIKTRILCSITFFLIRTVKEIMWRDIVDPGRPQMTI